MLLRLSTGALSRSTADALVCFRFADDGHALPSSDPVADRLRAGLEDWERTAGFKAGVGESLVFNHRLASVPGLVAVVGLGRRADLAPADVFKGAASAGRILASMPANSVLVPLHGIGGLPGISWERCVDQVAAGLQFGSYRFTKFLVPRGGRPERRTRAAVLHVPAEGRMAGPALRAAAEVGTAVRDVRDIANLPANEAPPLSIARMARRLAARSGIGCAVWDAARLRAEQCGALLAVGQGSANPPCLIVMKYPGRRRGLKPAVLVGKTITFDTGGISLKPAKNMEWMKYDKSGGMAVLGAMAAVGRLRPARPVIGLLAAAENMPGASATRPGDIVRSRGGKTIEIVNTDAEGRLVLADALSIATGFDPHCIVDLATLTGAAVTALGHVVSAVMGNESGLVEGLRAAGEATGERLWPLPLYPAYRAMLRSPFADLRNTGDGTAGSIAGGMFLGEFVDPRIPWAHIDLTHAWEEQDRPHAAAGATLFGTRLLIEWLRRDDP